MWTSGGGGWLLEDNRRATTADREMIGIVVIQHSLTSSPGHRVGALASCEIEAHSTSRYTMLLHELPIDVPVLPLLGTTGLARLEQTCKAFKDVCRSDSALMTAWKEAVDHAGVGQTPRQLQIVARASAGARSTRTTRFLPSSSYRRRDPQSDIPFGWRIMARA